MLNTKLLNAEKENLKTPAKKILIIEDDKAIRNILSAHLLKYGYHIIEAEDVNQGLQKFYEEFPDLVLTDLGFPNRDNSGLDIVEEIHKKYCEIPIIVLSGWSESEQIAKAYQKGADNYIAKPIMDYALLNHILVRAFERADMIKQIQDMPKKLAEALKKSQEQYKLIFEKSPLGLFHFDKDGVIRECNQKFVEIIGSSQQQLIGFNMLKKLNDEKLLQAVYEALAGKISQYEGEYHSVTADKITPVRVTAGAIQSAGKFLGGVGIVEDITERKEADKKIKRLRERDELTGLFNKDEFERQISKELRSADPFAIICFGLDHFKDINEVYGEEKGDEILIKIGKIFSDNTRDKIDIICRYGGDEYILLLPKVENSDQAVNIANKLRERLKNDIYLNNEKIRVTSSIGLSFYPSDGDSAQILLNKSKVAMKIAKEEGGDKYRLFDLEKNTKAISNYSLWQEINTALEEEKQPSIYPVYQPKITRNGEIKSVEALLRFYSRKQAKLISPQEVINIAEKFNIVNYLDMVIMYKSFLQNKNWLNSGQRINIAVNLSAQEFKHEYLKQQIQGLLSSTEIDPRDIELEITEGSFIDDFENCVKVLREIHEELGISIAIDDFGTGFSSLKYLPDLPLSTLKIDRFDVAGIGNNPGKEKLIKNHIYTAHNFDLKVVAEGVETAEQFLFLYENDCDLFQGKLFDMPLSAEDLTSRLKENNYEKIIKDILNKRLIGQ